MKSDDLKQAPKVFAESINIGFTPEFFVMGVSSGSHSTIYTLTPQHAKRLKQYLSHQISEYETENALITAEWKPTIVSPVQRANPPMEGS
jgi:hypothetical protein